MKILDTSNKYDSIYHHTLRLLGLADDDTAALPTADFMRSANIKLRDLAFELWRNSTDWEFDDSNNTDLPIATADLVASQQDYAMPTTVLSIERVEAMDDNGDYKVLKQIDKTGDKRNPHLERYSNEGLPIEYDLIGNSIFLFPTPNASDTTLSSGLRLYFSRDISEFDTTDTTKEPGVPKVFHPYIAYGVAYDEAVSKNMNEQRVRNLQRGVGKYEEKISTFYTKRNKDKRTRLKPKVRSTI